MIRIPSYSRLGIQISSFACAMRLYQGTWTIAWDLTWESAHQHHLTLLRAARDLYRAAVATFDDMDSEYALLPEDHATSEEMLAWAVDFTNRHR